MRRSSRILAFGALISCMLLGGAAVATKRTPWMLVMVGDTQHYGVVEVMDAIESSLAGACGSECDTDYRVSRVEPSAALTTTASGDINLVVTVGSHAARQVAQTGLDPPTLYTFLPRAVWQELQACCPGPDHARSALFIDQPLQRRFALLGQLVPGATRVGVLLGRVSAKSREDLQRVAEAGGFTLRLAEVGDSREIGSSLRHLIREVDVLLALPDPGVYNRNTAYSILLTTYSARVPVIGFSAAMVRAGAVAAVHATPDDVGHDIAQRIQAYRRDSRMPPADFGTVFSVSVNRDVARSLHLPILSEATLLQKLENTAQ